LGNPNDPEFQRDVLKHALSLLEYAEGPVLENYPHNAAETDVKATPLACPVDFTTRPKEMSNNEKLLQSLDSEISVMQTWYDIARKKACRSTTGTSGLTPKEIAKLYAGFIAGDIDDTELKGKNLSDLLRMATEDLKAYYHEAVSAQPGQPTDAQTLSDWFWGETYAASVINEVRKICLKHEAKDLVLAGKLLLVPRNQMYRF
jgi:hypothetical protein